MRYTTTYLKDPVSGATSQLVTDASGDNTWQDYFYAGGELLGMHVTPAANTNSTAYNRFFVRDNLGSIAVVTNEAIIDGSNFSGAVEHDSYDPWGKRRNTNGTDDAGGSLTSETSKGFTGHEQLDMLGLVNMSARVYDPLTGRFMSPDPVIQNLTNLQDLNPYSYVDNNPLSVTDPTGMCKGFLGCLGSFLPEIAAVAVIVVANQEWALPSLFETAGLTATESGVASAIVAGAAAGAISSGGNWQQTLIGAATAGAFYGIGAATGAGISVGQSGQVLANGGTETLQQWAASPQFLEDVAGQGLVGGLASIAEGGNFQSGFLAAGFSGAAGPGLAIAGPGYDNVLSESVTGGVGSVLGGGKFGSGALTGAFSYLFRGGVQAPGSNGGNQGGLYGIPVVGQIAQGVNWVGNQVEEAFSAAIGGTQGSYDGLTGGNATTGTMSGTIASSSSGVFSAQAISTQVALNLRACVTWVCTWASIVAGDPQGVEKIEPGPPPPPTTITRVIDQKKPEE
ncbi:MAG: RHS repeat-associated core domain-containing protein [Acidiphilium sp.]